jgi:hypothetical protein
MRDRRCRPGDRAEPSRALVLSRPTMYTAGAARYARSAMPRITDDHLAHWRRHGWALVPGFLTAAELAAIRDDVARYFPTDAEYRAAPERYPRVGGWRELPFVGDALNDLATHPELASFAERVIGTPDVLLTQAILWGKYAGVGDHEQPFHVDFPNNTLVYPRDEGRFTQTGTIVYLTDVTADLAPTYVVSKEHTREPAPLFPTTRPRDAFRRLYEHEVAVTAAAGSVLLYSMSTFHRGSGFRGATGARFSFHVVFRALDSHWMGFSAWARSGMEPTLHRFLERATPRQRALLGFPSPGHPYWDRETLAGVAARYPAMDMTPYRDACR